MHRDLKITDEQRERFVAAYLEALDEAELPNDEPFRGAVREHVEFGTRVAQQNSRAGPTPSCTRSVKSRAGSGARPALSRR